MNRYRLLACLALFGSLALAPPGVQAQTCDPRDSAPTYAAGSPSPIVCDLHGSQRVTVTNSTGSAVSSATATANAPTYVEGATNVPLSLDLAGNQRFTQTTCLSGESACIGTSPDSYIMVAPVARALGGATTLSYISVGTTEDEHAVCTAACTLYWIAATNTNAAVRYLKCENDTAANTAPGTDTPELRFAIPGNTAGAGNNPDIPAVGLAFTTGLTCWLVTGAADSDVAEVAANELMVNYGFKQ